jgi:hypothetical protein
VVLLKDSYVGAVEASATEQESLHISTGHEVQRQLSIASIIDSTVMAKNTPKMKLARFLQEAIPPQAPPFMRPQEEFRPVI